MTGHIFTAYEKNRIMCWWVLGDSYELIADKVEEDMGWRVTAREMENKINKWRLYWSADNLFED
ncbi:MAG: hypothetical protein M4579_001677 [Chaenotheca gracillima]|nr:MAG: hypothetical protein M4579_001677 [Chaenotheca gracillima]